MKILNKVKVGGIFYKVIQNYIFKETELMGQAEHRETEIRISSKTPNNTCYSRQKIEECFLHEILHCVDNIYNCQKLDEDTITRLSQGLYQVFNDNKIF